MKKYYHVSATGYKDYQRKWCRTMVVKHKEKINLREVEESIKQKLNWQTCVIMDITKISQDDFEISQYDIIGTW